MTFSRTLEVLEVADTIDLTTLDRLKQELAITDSSQDAKLTAWIHEVSGQIGARINRVLGRETLKETFELGWNCYLSELPLSRYPVAYIDSVNQFSGAVTSDNYRFDVNKGVLFRRYGSWSGTVEVQYQAGYQLLGELPYDLEYAAILLLTYRNYGARNPGLRSESVPGVYEATYWVGATPGSSGALPPDVEELLLPYIDRAV